jgi:hypothetical protein
MTADAGTGTYYIIIVGTSRSEDATSRRRKERWEDEDTSCVLCVFLIILGVAIVIGRNCVVNVSVLLSHLCS